MTFLNQQTLTGPYSGLAQKIAFARRMALEAPMHSEVRSFAENASGKGARTQQAQALFDILRKTCTYHGDPVGMEMTKAPWVMIQEIKSRGFASGDCDDQALLAYVLLRSIGIPSSLRVVWMNGAENPSHIYALAYLNGAWVPFDTTSSAMGKEPNYDRKADFE